MLIITSGMTAVEARASSASRPAGVVGMRRAVSWLPEACGPRAGKMSTLFSLMQDKNGIKTTKCWGFSEVRKLVTKELLCEFLHTESIESTVYSLRLLSVASPFYTRIMTSEEVSHSL